MTKRFVICEINQNYLNNVKKQMKDQKMPVPKDDSHITIAHNPVTTLEVENLDCECNVCKQLMSI